jgi:hypothetical protein
MRAAPAPTISASAINNPEIAMAPDTFTVAADWCTKRSQYLE